MNKLHLLAGIVVLASLSGLVSPNPVHAGIPCNGPNFAGTGCEITQVVPTASLICTALPGRCPIGSLPHSDGVSPSGAPHHVVIDDDGVPYVVRSGAGCCSRGDLVKVIPGIGGTIHSTGFEPTGLAWDPDSGIEGAFYISTSQSGSKAILSTPKAGGAVSLFSQFSFSGTLSGVTTSAGKVFATRNINTGHGYILEVQPGGLQGPFLAFGLGNFVNGITVDGSGDFITNGIGSGGYIPSGSGYVTRSPANGDIRFQIIAPSQIIDGAFFKPAGNPAVTPGGQIVVTSDFPSSSVVLVTSGTTSGTGTAATIHSGSPFVFPSGAAITLDGQDILVIDKNGTLFRITGALTPPNQAPIANAGLPQTKHPGEMVTLDGSGSADPDGNTPLTFAWTVTSQPAGSTASLSDSTASNPTLTFDSLGNYTLQLVVTDTLGAASAADDVIVSTFNTPPVADAGADSLLTELFVPVTLDGTQSFDDDGDDFTYFWSLTTPGGLAMLDDNISDMPSFTPDVQGDYVVEVVVTDIFGASSDPAQVTLGFTNLTPVADAGGNQSVSVGDTVLVNGMGDDANNDPLTFSWSFVETPAGSAAAFSDPNSANTDFIADVEGNFVASLVVNDGLVDSDASNISILATTVVSQTITLLRDAIVAVNAVPQGSLKNRKMHKPLTNKINAAIALVADGRLADARDKLLNDVGAKTDGCAKEGAPDRNDWVTDCSDQDSVSTLISDAIALLDGLI